MKIDPMLSMYIVFAVWLASLVIYSYRDFCNQWKAKAHGIRAPPNFINWLRYQFVTARRYQKHYGLERGAMNIGGIMMLGIAFVFLAIGFIFLPITTDATTTLLAYEYSTNTSITDATFTGYTSVLGITPLLILVGFVAASVVAGMMGIKVMKGAAAASANPGSLLLLGLSIVFIGIGLIIEPVMLDGISSIVHGGGSGISTSYTGYSAIILVTPMLVHLGFISSAVLSGFFGLKKLGSTAG